MTDRSRAGRPPHLIHRFASIVLLLILVAGCDIVESEDDDASAGDVFVGNQGEFGAGNGSITRYNPESNAAAIAYRNLESIVQSIEVQDGDLYIAANTGGRIDVYDYRSGQLRGRVEGLVSPRYMAFTTDRLFVSNLYGGPDTYSGGTVSVIDRGSFDIVEDVPVGDNPDGIAVAGNRVFVANAGFGYGRTVSIIDVASLSVLQDVDVGCDGPRFVVPDNDGEVFVFCTGQTIYNDDFEEIGSTDGAIVILDASSGAVRDRIEIDGRMMSAEFGQDAYHHPDSERIFALRESDGRYSVLVIDTQSNTIIDEVGPFDDRIGAVAFDPVEEVLYLSRIASFTQSGSVGVYDLDGELIRTFSAGVAPTSIRFAPR